MRQQILLSSETFATFQQRSGEGLLCERPHRGGPWVNRNELEISRELWERPKPLFAVKNPEPQFLQHIRNLIEGRGE